ncbi:MAG: Fic family protein [Gemmatimonadaceae bacterium]|nr:Fic family protein [Gemmatimonadaceae bacterium]
MTWQYNSATNAPAKYRKACKYDVFIPDFLASSDIQLEAKTMGMVSEAENAIRTLNDVARPGLRPLARLLLRTESIASSKVEGLQLGVRELARAEARKESGGKPGPTALEILSNIDAMQLAIEEAATVKRFSVKEIEAVHRRLMENAPNAHVAGQIRTQQNWIGGNDHNPCGADYVPPPPEHVAPLLADLCDAVNDDVLPPLVQAALVHAQFETIHPFDDGNGRTGRALIQIVLRRREIASAYVPPISVILAKSKARYIRGLTQFREEGGAAPWIEQFADATASAANLARTYLTAVQELTTQWRHKLSASVAPRSDSVAWTLIDILPAHPMITGPVAMAATEGSRPSVYKALQDLQTAGVLIPLSEGRRNQSWEAAGLLDLLAQLEAGELPA